MAIVIRSEATAHCRICGHSEIIIPLAVDNRSDFFAEVKSKMKKLGWTISIGECLCPKCSKTNK